MPFFAAGLVFFFAGCSIFNFPIPSAEYAFVFSSANPRITIFEISRSALSQIRTHDLSANAPFSSAISNLLVFAGNGASGTGTFSYSGGVLGSPNAITSPARGMGISNDGTKFYYCNANDSIAVRSITSGTIGGSNLQSIAGHGIGNYYDGNYVFATSGRYFIASASGDPNPAVFALDSSTGLISGLGGVGITSDATSNFSLPLLGSDYYWAGYASGVDIISVNPSTFSVTVSAQSTATNFSVAARHPTEGWVYVATSSGIDRYSVSTSSVSRVESAASTTGTTLSLALSSSGKRLFRLTSTEFSMYSVSASGGLILLSQATVANAFRVTLMPYR